MPIPGELVRDLRKYATLENMIGPIITYSFD